MAQAQNVSVQPTANVAHQRRPREKALSKRPEFLFIWAMPVVDHNCCTAALGEKKIKRRGQDCAEQTPQKCFNYCRAPQRRAARILIRPFRKLSPTFRPSLHPKRVHWPRAGLRNHVINSFICHVCAFDMTEAPALLTFRSAEKHQALCSQFIQ